MRGIFAVECKPYEITLDTGKKITVENEKLIGFFTDDDGFTGVCLDPNGDDWEISEITLSKEEFDEIKQDYMQIFRETAPENYDGN